MFKSHAFVGLLLASSLLVRQEPAKSRIELVPIKSDRRLEDILESPDGTRLLTHDRGFVPKLWDPRSMRILRNLGGSHESIDWVDFSWKGDYILTHSSLGVGLYDSKLGLKRYQLASDKSHSIVAAQISRDGKLIGLITQEGQLGLADMKAPESLTWYEAVPDPRSIDISADGSRVLVAGAKGQAAVLSSQGQVVSKMQPGGLVKWGYLSEDGAQALLTTISPDNDSAEELAVFGKGGAFLYDVGSGKKLATLPHYTGDRGVAATMMAARFVGPTHDGVLYCERSGTMPVIDRNTLKPVIKLEGHTDAVRELRVSRDGKSLGTYGRDEQLKLWNIETGKEYSFDRPSDLPTAADFSAAGAHFWVGYSNGSIRRHELATGKVSNITYGAMKDLDDFNVMAGGNRLLLTTADHSAFSSATESVAVGITSNGRTDYPRCSGRPVISPDGKYGFFRLDGEHGYLIDLVRDKKLCEFKKEASSPSFSPDGSLFACSIEQDVVVVLCETGTPIASCKAADKGEIMGVNVRNAGDLAIAVNESGEALLCHLDSDKVTSLGKLKGLGLASSWSPDGKWVAMATNNEVTAWNVETGKSISHDLGNEPQWGARAPIFGLGGRLVCVGRTATLSLDLATGQAISTPYGNKDSGNPSPSQSLMPLVSGTQAHVWNYQTGALTSIDLTDEARAATFTPDGKRLLALDATDGVTIWDIDGSTPKKLGSLQIGVDSGWLAMDSEGRYDASDPAHVEGASYVLQWDGGLEPISVNQLKSQYYEPGLLAKLLGIDKDAVRAVPNLDSLRLFPVASIKPDPKNKNIYAVSVEERDGGGVGKVSVFVNGKLVVRRDGDGYFKIDLNDYVKYMLPQAELGGGGNQLSVVVANDSGTLSSDPITTDVGVPAQLASPDVNLYALCVGVGDYAGSQGDLKAPPSDASTLAKGLEKVASNLLPGRVHVRTLVTGSEAKPTKANITAWFDEVSKTAKSTDIVVVFLSGHGTSAIGDKKDYFFLTMEADPTDVNAATAITGAISGEELKSMLATISANKQVVILDTCHSGAAAKELIMARSVSGDYQRAYEGIKDATGTWLLAGTAADQLSYESSNVEHGMLTYGLLEALDTASPTGLRQGSGSQLFVDVERWLTYAADRVESLKNEVGISGIQRPEFKRSAARASFDLGVTTTESRGFIGLHPPVPIVIVGPFEKDQEDPAGLEPAVGKALRNAQGFKAWFDVAKHPNVFRVAGSYEVEGDAVTVKVVIQRFDAAQSRKTLQTFTVKGSAARLDELAEQVRTELETRVKDLAKG
ncbi:MAG: caspase family protein [Armatimonadetes bacterium]|nr:caspase family protein [Armatimonadota bacterium]